MSVFLLINFILFSNSSKIKREIQRQEYMSDEFDDMMEFFAIEDEQNEENQNDFDEFDDNNKNDNEI